jgi:hypothetical protein
MGSQVCCPQLPNLVAHFIYEEQHPDADLLDQYPPIITRGYSYSSAVATFYAPSELCGALEECIGNIYLCFSILEAFKSFKV